MSEQALAEEDSRWLLQTTIYTTHFSSSPQHNSNQKLLNPEYQRTNRWLVGAAAFDSSFDQPMQYVYFGKLWRPFESAPLVHGKLTGGLIPGYKDEFRDKMAGFAFLHVLNVCIGSGLDGHGSRYEFTCHGWPRSELPETYLTPELRSEDR